MVVSAATAHCQHFSTHQSNTSTSSNTCSSSNSNRRRNKSNSNSRSAEGLLKAGVATARKRTV
jgi:hypothetical protein